MEQKIIVAIESKYGREVIYPVNEQASIFAAMLKQTSLTRDNIASIKKLGYSVEVKQYGVEL